MNSKEPFIGRFGERRLFKEILSEPGPAFVAVYGRRRVGKTFLVRRASGRHLKFELTGIRDASLKEQLETFGKRLAEQSEGKFCATPKSWFEAFDLLARWMETLPRTSKHVVFLDEMPWLAGPRSRFLSALDQFWNTWGSKWAQLILVVCGSAASWMIRKLLHDKGGLHNRVTHRIRLAPFSLGESRELLHKGRKMPMSNLQIAELYMALGGIPYYLKLARRGESAAQIVDRACFRRHAPLRNEFKMLYPALFDSPDSHMGIVRALAKKPLTYSEIAAASGLAGGGTLTMKLRELHESGFIRLSLPFGKKKKDTLYHLSDEYTLYYLKWIESWRGDDGGWTKMRSSPRWHAWSGIAFEEMCTKHLNPIKSALGISGVYTESSAWTYRPTDRSETGTQIDMLIDRADDCINLCEMKYSDAEFVIDKGYASILRQRRETFRRVTGTRKNLFLTFVTTHGVKNNAYGLELVDASVTLDALFKIEQ